MMDVRWRMNVPHFLTSWLGNSGALSTPVHQNTPAGMSPRGSIWKTSQELTLLVPLLFPQSLAITLGITFEISHWYSNSLPSVCFWEKLKMSGTLKTQNRYY